VKKHFALAGRGCRAAAVTSFKKYGWTGFFLFFYLTWMKGIKGIKKSLSSPSSMLSKKIPSLSVSFKLSMCTTRVLALISLCSLWLIPSAFGVERFPPPEFESGYVMPQPSLPLPRAQWLEWLDVAVLFVALSLSTWFVLNNRSRRWIAALGIFSLLYFGFYRKGCVCAIGSIQNISLAIFDNGYAVPLTVVAFFFMPIFFAIIFGRTFCAAVCPQGAIQDLVLLKPIKLKPWLEQTLRLIPFIYLAAAVLFAATGSAFIICQWDPFIAFFRRSGSATMLAIGAAFLLIGVFVGRPYCRFLCPYGALLSCFSRFSKWKVTLTRQDCLQCALCDAACPYGAIADPAVSAAKKTGKGRVQSHILFAVCLAILLTLSGWKLAVPFSQINPTVRLAEQIARENITKAQPTEESLAFRQSGRPVAELMDQAGEIYKYFMTSCIFFGTFLGLVFGMKIISLTLSQPRTAFEPDSANCVACGRCYPACPKKLRARSIQIKK